MFNTHIRATSVLATVPILRNLRNHQSIIVFVAAYCLCGAGCGSEAGSSSGNVATGFNLFLFFLYLVFVVIPCTALLFASWLQPRNKWFAERLAEYPPANKVLDVVNRIIGPSVPTDAKHPVLSWLTAPVFYIFAFWFSSNLAFFISGRSFLGILFCFTIFLIGIVCLRRRLAWHNYTLRWLYWRDKSEVGTFSQGQLAQLFKAGQIDSKTPIRQFKDDEWRTGMLLETPPRRVVRGLVCGAVALMIGFPLSAGIFGKISHDGHTRHLAIEEFFENFSLADARRLHGMENWESNIRGGVRTFDTQIARRTTGFLPGRIGGGVDQFTGSFREDDSLMIRNVERAQNRTLGFTALMILLSALGGAALAPARVQIVKESLVDVT